MHEFECALLSGICNLLNIALFHSLSLQVFGFLNFVLWAGNIWFVFKETGWHKGASSLAGGGSEKQSGTFNNQGILDQSAGYNTQGNLSQPTEYSQVGGPTSYSNQMQACLLDLLVALLDFKPEVTGEEESLFKKRWS